MKRTIVLGADREKLHKHVQQLTPAQRDAHDAWIAERPPAVRAVAEKIDMMAVWRIKEGAPYVITLPGTVGTIQGLRECADGIVRVLFVAHVLVTDHPMTPDGPIVTPLEVEWIEEDPCPWPN